MLAAIQQSKVSYQVCSAYQRGVKRGVHHHHHRHHHHHIHCGRCAPVFAVIPEAASARALAPASLPVLPAERVTGAFRMKHFDVWHNLCAMKMGTDAMLLGSWVHPGAACRILDVGCGTGVLALMAVQRSQPNAHVEAIDVDADACTQATQNVRASPWPDRVRVLNMSLQNLVAQVAAVSSSTKSSPGSICSPSKSSAGGPCGQYDLIISNPPFFQDSFKTLQQAREARIARKRRRGGWALLKQPTQENAAHSVTANPVSSQPTPSISGREAPAHGLESCRSSRDGDLQEPCLSTGEEQMQAQSGQPASAASASYASKDRRERRVLARHADANQGLNYKELAEGASKLLVPGGRLCLILPALQGEADRFIATARAEGLILRQSLRVATKDEDIRERRRLMEFVKPPHVPPASHLSTLGAQDLDSRLHTLQSDTHDDPSTAKYAVGPLLVTSIRRRVGDEVIRSPSQEYLELTADFHHPAFIKDMVLGKLG